jgi:hypothetical protein
MTTSTTTDVFFTGPRIRRENAGNTRLTHIPTATGTSTTANTWTSLSVCSPMFASSARKWFIDNPTTIGNVTTASTELIAVRVTFNATSPRARWLKRFAMVPPGEATRIIIPTANTGGTPASSTIPKHNNGRTTS